MFGVDCTSTRDPAGLKRAGVHFVCRYLSPTPWKNLTRFEALTLTKAGLQIVTVYESTGQTVKGGYHAGVRDAEEAEWQLRLIGAPKTAPVYFAIDYDPPDSDRDNIVRYFKGAAAVIAPNRVGVYGSFKVCGWLHEVGLAKWYWQTSAWSHGQLQKFAHLLQTHNGKNINGLQVDYDTAFKANYGQWRPPLIHKPKPKPTYSVEIYQGPKVVKAISTRFPGLALVRFNVARRKPSRFEGVRLGANPEGN